MERNPVRPREEGRNPQFSRRLPPKRGPKNDTLEKLSR